VHAAASSGADRADLARVINGWELSGMYHSCNDDTILTWIFRLCEDKGFSSSGGSIYLQLLMNISDIEITQRYLICNPLPKTTNPIEDITDKMYQRMVAREDEAIQKLRQVIDFATGEDCE
jgi:hypothetical protein